MVTAFALLVCVLVSIMSSAVKIKICRITAGIKKYKSIVKKKIRLLGKDKWNIIEVLISKALIHSYICHDEFLSVNNVLRDCYEMEGETKKS